MPRPTPLLALVICACDPAATDSSACPEIAGETHLATEASSPDGL
jgi:hypothetical protein